MLQKINTDIIYPETDGLPMADNTKQFRLIVTIKENLELLFQDRSDVFVAGDLFWYPVEGDNTIRSDPDVMVVFGRPKGDRGSYLQWKENNTPPQVVFEILSPGNRPREMSRKLLFYQRYGVVEYYLYDPEENELEGYIRNGAYLEEIPQLDGWVSPALGIKFTLGEIELEIYRPDGSKFLSFIELDQQRKQALAEKEQERFAKEQALTEKEQALVEIARLKELLRSQNINPDLP